MRCCPVYSRQIMETTAVSFSGTIKRCVLADVCARPAVVTFILQLMVYKLLQPSVPFHWKIDFYIFHIYTSNCCGSVCLTESILYPPSNYGTPPCAYCSYYSHRLEKVKHVYMMEHMTA